MLRVLLLIWFLFALAASKLAAEPAIGDARVLLAQQPSEVIRLYQLVTPELELSPAWLQRDWHLLATRAHLQLRNWPAAKQALLAADSSLVVGLSGAEVALLGGTLSYHQQETNNAWFWFRCADSFSTPPETRARILLNLGVMASRQQRLDVARNYYQQGLQLAEVHQFSHLLPMFYNNLGLWYWRNGLLPAAEQMLKQALYQHSRNSGPEAQARTMVNLLLVLASDRQWDKFNRYLPEANALVRRQLNADYALSLTLFNQLQQFSLHEGQILPAEIIALASQFKSVALRQSVATLLQQFQISWQPATPATLTETALELPNTRQQCALVDFQSAVPG